MDELRSFFNSGSTGVTKLKGGLTGGLRITKEDSTYDMNRREEHRHSVVMSGTDYAREAKRKETEAYMTRNDPWDSVPGGLDSLENFSTYSSMQNIGLKEEAMTEIYKKYTFQMKEDTKSLSIFEYKQQILDNIKAYPVVIIEGPTGCGKTTQVPQWILDECYNNRKPCKIIVTQPRRIAAISIAKRVAQERGWDVGGVVGYQVGLENRTTTDTRIHYVTTGVLLQKLVAAKNMNEYTHIILDEVHERGQEMDFLLLVTKKLLNTVSSSVRVILMSATIEQKAFTDYFSIGHDHAFRLHGMSTMSATVKIVKKDPMFTVKKFYLNHLHKFGSMVTPATPSDIPGIAPEMHHLVVKLLNAFELIDKQEDNYADRSEADLPSVLIFLPGINEIEDLFDALNDLALRRKLTDAQNPTYKWWVLPLHSTITADEQVRVFQRAPPGSRKIILATNIAESSITVPDIKYVIDYCLMKQLVVDENTNFTSLQLSWASKTNCEQRAGRAGRVRDGRVYRLVNDTFYENLKQECTPEIIRCPLERLVLLAKMLDMGAPSEVLALAMDPPDLSNIHRTVLVLKEVGALKKFLDDEWSSLDGDITYLGRVMAKLPLDVRVSKLIMLGYIYGVLDEAVIMAAAMTVKSIFSSPFRERLHAYNSKLTWADGSTSDCIAFYNVYKVWNHLRRQQYFKQQGNNEAQWARRFYVQVRALRELDDMVREIRMRLSREGIDAHNGPCVWSKSELPLVLKVIIAGAFYPQYFVQVSQDEHREFNAIKTLAGLDPRNTVYLKNFPDDQPGDIYATAIKNAVIQHTSEEPRVTFDTNSKKVFLTFSDESQGSKHGDPTIPGQVVLPVYKAIKARQLRIDIRIPLLPLEKALALSNVLKTSRLNIDLDRLVPRLPEIDDTYFPLKFTESVENLSKFWVRYDDVSTESELRQIFNVLNNTPLVAHTGDVFAGDMYAAPYSEGKITSMYRALVLKVLPRDMVELRYVDYGTFGRVSTSSLRILPGPAVTTPPLCMSCRLAGVQPAPLPEPRALWAPRAAGLVKHRAQGKLIAKVYSVVHGVVSIELLTADGNININDELIERGLAVRCEESYDSKLNHDLRMSAQDLSLVQKRAHNREQKELAFFHLKEMDPPNARECDADVTLKGPFSPLESTLHNLMYASREKEVQIEWNSVNSVLLDTEPQELYERLVVAGQVGQNDTGSKLTLRHTTLMPNIPGLPAIIALLFCPVAELRRDSGRSRYVSALCGLGSTDAGAPYFPEHDLLVDIDAELSVDDIGLQKLPESQTMTKPTAQKAVAGKSNGKKTGKQSADKSTAGAQTATKPAVDKPDSAKPETSKPRPSKPAERDPNYRPTSGDPHVDMLVEHEEEKLLMYNTMKYYRSKTRINHLRHLMDYMMYCEDGLDTPARNDQFAPSVPKYIKDDFNNLLMKRRKHFEPQSVVNAWEWKSVPEEEVLEITNPEMMERSVIYPLHSPQELHPISADTIMHLQRETDKLKQLVQRATLPSSNELVCKLCSTAPMPAHAMRIHLYSNAHRERESEFRTF